MAFIAAFIALFLLAFIIVPVVVVNLSDRKARHAAR